MANVYNPATLGVKAPSGGFKQGGWYSGRQYWNGTLSDPGTIHPESNQTGAGQAVSAEVNAQSAAQQGVTPQQFDSYLQQQTTQQQTQNVQPVANIQPKPQQQQPQPTAPSSPAVDMMALKPAAPATIDLPAMYDQIYKTSGISDLEAQYSKMEQDFIEAQGKINDNPFLSEATRVGRIAKLQQLFNERTANIKNDITTRKAEVETKVNLQTKQYDITRQEYKDNLDRFNMLLSSGALTDASGEDLASLSAATGIAPSMIQSIVNTAKADKIKPQVLTSTDDNGNVTVSVIDANTGDVIKQTGLGAIGNAEKGSGGTGLGSKAVQALKDDISNWATLQELAQKYVGVLPQATVVSAYTTFHSQKDDPWGPPKESPQQLNEMFGNTAGVSLSKLSAQDQANVKKLKDAIYTGMTTRDEAAQAFPEYAQYL